MVAAPHMMYPGGHHPQFLPPSGPPQQVPGANGYPSPGRPTAPMMVHQGSQQGHNMQYGMSPNVQYNQPAYVPGQTSGPMSSVRAYNGPGSQHFGTSPQQVHHHQYGSQPHGGSNNYNKNHAPQGHHPGPRINHAGSGPSQGRGTDSSGGAK
ncbi:hypothetical protein PT974_00370 [Cladobotryum mycophilum]|uniref:Uncharacterized protein n=1 Tax=Cladobotryum mycophilum TaxID=491253 RepID=A0ABR0T1W9_9HYPO